MSKTISLNYTVKPINYEKINEEFVKLRCYVMATGKNRNFSYISKETVQNSLYSLSNIPVVAHVKKREDGTYYIGAHDKQIVIEENDIIVNDLTVPFGVVPENSNPEFVNVTENNGTISEYLVCDVILWNGRYNILDAKSQTDKDIYFNQSMEIGINTFKQLDDDKNYTDITDFTFSALCLLGRDKENPEYHSEPCFPSSRVEPYNYSLNDSFKDEFSLMMSELKKLAIDNECSTKNQSSLEVDNINNSFSKEDEKEVKVLNEEKIKLLDKYNLSVDKLDFEIEELTIEELDTKLKEFAETQNTIEPENTSFSTTYNQKREALRNALDSIYVKDGDGNIIESTYFYVMDFDDAHVFAEKDYWNAEGDFQETKGRFAYSFDEATITATITSEWEEMFMVWLTAEEKAMVEADKEKFSLLETEFAEYKESYKTAETDVEELRTYQSKVIEDQRKEDEKKVFEMPEFEKLKDNEEFEALKNKASEFETIDALVDKCFSILGRVTTQFSLEAPVDKKTVKVTIDTTDSSDDAPYGGLFDKYKTTNN